MQILRAANHIQRACTKQEDNTASVKDNEPSSSDAACKSKRPLHQPPAQSSSLTATGNPCSIHYSSNSATALLTGTLFTVCATNPSFPDSESSRASTSPSQSYRTSRTPSFSQSRSSTQMATRQLIIRYLLQNTENFAEILARGPSNARSCPPGIRGVGPKD